MLSKRKKVGVLTFHYAFNYGGVMQAFALLSFLKIRGFDAYIIDRVRDNRNSFKIWIKRNLINPILGYRFYKFSREYLIPKTIRFSNGNSMKALNDADFYAIIVGSDQVWRSEFTEVGYNYFLDFLGKNVKKIAYAASFGKPEWRAGDLSVFKVKKYLNEFDLITVREINAVEICKSEFDVFAKHVIDPTLLLTKNDYVELLKLFKQNRKYILSYILGVNELKLSFIKKTSDYFKIPSKDVIMSLSNFVSSGPGVRDWINSFYNAQFIVTDSFHGTAFSIIFNKQFVILENEDTKNVRFLSLLNQLGLEDRYVSSEDTAMELFEKQINYEMVNNKLEILRKHSIDILMESLSDNFDE